MPFAPNEDPTGTYPLVKQRILDMIKAWVQKGWLSKGEINGAMGVVAEGPPPGPPAPLVFKETPKAPKEENKRSARPTRNKEEQKSKPPTRQTEKASSSKKNEVNRGKEEEMLGPELTREQKKNIRGIEKGVSGPEKKPGKLAVKPKKEEKPVEPEFEGTPVRGRLPDGRTYWTDAKGKFIPPDRWEEVVGVKPGLKDTLTLEELTAYRKARQAATNQPDLFAEPVKKPVEPVVSKETPKNPVKEKKPATKKQRAPATPLFVPPVPEPKTDDEIEAVNNKLHEALDNLMNEDERGPSVKSLESAMSNIESNWPDGRDIEEDINGWSELKDAITDYHGAENNEEREEAFDSVTDAIDSLEYVTPEVEEPEEIETSVGPGVQPGILASIIPEGQNRMWLSEAFKALQAKGILKATKNAAELAVEELKFKNILTEELENRQIIGGAGAPGNMPVNRRLRVGEVTGFIERIRR
jgi:hypothetical protein